MKRLKFTPRDKVGKNVLQLVIPSNPKTDTQVDTLLQARESAASQALFKLNEQIMTASTDPLVV